MEINTETLIDFYCKSKPRLVFEIDETTLKTIRTIYGGNGHYLWSPSPLNEYMDGKLLGVDVTVVKEKCFQLRYIFSDGSSQIEKFEGF